MPCSWDQVYINTTKLGIRTLIGEHSRYCQLGQSDKSAVAEHAISNTDHCVLFDKSRVLSTVGGIHMEFVQIHKQVRIAMNRWGESDALSRIWNSVSR